ncbi:hypothetical protein FA15DRAFT_197163 [Coprinopsis marcescibilis]|uniref:Uncharacterized protein n=1 Tax=Coprinopsis marcescibilis TaxID=230819 RepID=A0A5C3LMZ3_COPMA|nr:hypothetical protein FA15DRAFT_197163 [Coprinopsis marcescibilis]
MSTSSTPVAECVANHWTINSLGQSPCEVAGLLAQVCTGVRLILPQLPERNEYYGPNSTNQNSCRCSSVLYSLISACAHCQERNYVEWSKYKENCTAAMTPHSGSFPFPLPPGVAVPSWAYQDVEKGDTFDISAAIISG